jgi:uncharacterized membrane protein YccC
MPTQSARTKSDAVEHDYRLARKNLIEAIAALSDSAGRMSIEPMAARRGLEEMAALLIAAHGLVAQLSAARLAARTGAPAPDEATREWVQARLASEPDADATARQKWLDLAKSEFLAARSLGRRIGFWMLGCRRTQRLLAEAFVREIRIPDR